MILTVVDKVTGAERRAHILNDDEAIVTVPRTEPLLNPYWDFAAECWKGDPLPVENEETPASE